MERMSDERLAEIEADLSHCRIGNKAGLVPELLPALKAERAKVERLREYTALMDKNISRALDDYHESEARAQAAEALLDEIAGLHAYTNQKDIDQLRGGGTAFVREDQIKAILRERSK